MTVLYFDNQFFQRGQTWRECLESWETDREEFLRRVQKRPILKTALKRLSLLPKGTRIAVYYSQRTLDSRMNLPAVGALFQQIAHIETRYFCDAFFFPALYEALGRKAPQILLQKETGVFHSEWGPRPEPLTRELAEMKQDRPGANPDAWLVGLDRARRIELLDQSLAQFGENALAVCRQPNNGSAGPDKLT